jgi:hypothetical protein
MPGRAFGLGPALGVLGLTGLIASGCAELGAPMPPELAKLIGPPQKHFEGAPAHAGVPIDVAPPVEPRIVTTPSAPPPAPPAPATVASVTPLARPPLKDVRELIGLERHELQARLGDPVLRRRDAPAEIWQYRSALCVLDLFLYRDGPAMRVSNAELRPRDGRELPAATCLSSL